MKIALGIPTYNRGNILVKTIEDALKQNPPADEIIVVDQSDWYPEGVKEKLLEFSDKGFILLIFQEKANLPVARNRILVESACDIVIFIDDDVEMAPGFIGAHKSNYYDSSVSAVCGRITEQDIAIRPYLGRNWPKILDYKLFDFGWNVRVNDFGIVKGCNHSVLREYVLSLGGYDEEFFGVAMREEGDMAFRILEASGLIQFDPIAYLHHLRSPAGGCRVSVWGDWSAGSSVLRFSLKHRKLLGRYFWPEFWHAYRLGVINKNNLSNPWYLFKRILAFNVELIKLLKNLKR